VVVPIFSVGCTPPQNAVNSVNLADLPRFVCDSAVRLKVTSVSRAKRYKAQAAVGQMAIRRSTQLSSIGQRGGRPAMTSRIVCLAE